MLDSYELHGIIYWRNFPLPKHQPTMFGSELKFGWTEIYKVYTVDPESFVVKKVTWDKSLMHFNFVKAESIVYMSTKNYVTKKSCKTLAHMKFI